jgi:hypothetical protein
VTRIRTSREPTVRIQGGAWVGSGLREGNGPFQGSLECVWSLFFVPVGRE